VSQRRTWASQRGTRQRPGGRPRTRSAVARDWFVKGHGLGNDYLVLDPRALSFRLTPAAVQAICDRHRGVGSDGILTLASSKVADFGMRIFNPDGSEAEKSGNGLRILARFLRDHGYTRKREFSVETLGGVAQIRLDLRGREVAGITVDVGRASFASADIPVAGERREVVDEPLILDGEILRVTALSVGNPHCVVFMNSLDPATLRRLGPRLETHPAFPRRTNVQLARVISRRALEILIWERGAGETQASGTSACAAAAAAVRRGLADRAVTVGMPGGRLEVTIDRAWSITLTGPAELVCRGTFSGGLLARLRAARSR
jgi:diaminopimelate epimerase